MACLFVYAFGCNGYPYTNNHNIFVEGSLWNIFSSLKDSRLYAMMQVNRHKNRK